MLTASGHDSIQAVRPQRKFWPVAFLVGSVLAALALRLYRLDSQSVWYDEVFALSISRLPFAQMGAALVRDLVHPPLHYITLHWWFQAFGFGPLQGRLLSALFGTLSVPMIYLLAHYLFDRRTAILSALVLATSQLAIMYSQEARPYAQFLFLFLACAYTFLRALREQSTLFWVGFLGLGSLLIYTHYYGFFVLASFVVFGAAYRKQFRVSRVWLIGGMLWLVLSYLPWLSSGIIGEALHGKKVSMSANQNPPAEHWYTVFTVLNTFNNGRPDGLLESAPWWTFVAGGVLFSLPAAFALWPLARRHGHTRLEESERQSLAYLVVLCAVPIVLAFGAGFLFAFYNIRYIAFCAAPYYILVARGIARSPSAWRPALMVALLAYSALSLRANYFIPYKEDYKQAFASVAHDYQPGDCAVVAPPWEERQARWAWSIYEGDRPALPMFPIEAVISGAERCNRVWLISVFYRDNPPALRDAQSARTRLAQTYAGTDRRRFFWVDIDLYEAHR